MTTILWVLGGIIVVLVLVGAIKTGKPAHAIGSSGVQGLCALAAVNVAAMFSGVSLGLTAFSATVCVVLGIPGVVTMLLLQVICGL